MKNIAIIPARSGSKGLKDKNIKELNGKPLMAYSIDAARHSKLFHEIMVSTDSKQYAKIACEFGAKVPFLRSDDLSGDFAGSWDVVKDVLMKYRELGERYDTVCLLQPTSPLRTQQDIINAYTLFDEKKADAVTSVCEVDHSPLWSMVLPQDGSLRDYNKIAGADAPRQSLDTYHRFNGAIYIRRIQYTDTDVYLLSENEYAYIMERSASIDIDTELDFVIAECLLKSNVFKY